MVEWFTESKDENAAVEEFMQIFKEKDKASKEELLKIFLKSFLKHYHSNKEMWLSGRITAKDMYAQVYSSFNSAVKDIQRCVGQSEKVVAERLGCALGESLAAIEYAIPNPSYSIAWGNILSSRENKGAPLLARAEDFRESLKRIDRGVKHKFIASRIKKIAAKHAGQLSPELQKFLAQFAAIISS